MIAAEAIVGSIDANAPGGASVAGAAGATAGALAVAAGATEPDGSELRSFVPEVRSTSRAPCELPGCGSLGLPFLWRHAASTFVTIPSSPHRPPARPGPPP